MPDLPPVSRRGVLCLSRPCGPGGGVRLVLVLRVDPARGAAEVALVHPFVELATATDGIVPAAATGLPHDVVVQSELRGMVWVHQLSRPRGHVAEETLTAVSAVVSGAAPGVAELGQPSARGARAGVPLGGPRDRRWAFKVAQGRALDLLTGACTAALLADAWSDQRG